MLVEKFSGTAVVFNDKLSRIFLINRTAFGISGQTGYPAALSGIQCVPFPAFRKEQIHFSFGIRLCATDPLGTAGKTYIGFCTFIHADSSLQVRLGCPDGTSVLIDIDERFESFRGIEQILLFLVLFYLESTAADTEYIFFCLFSIKRFFRSDQIRKRAVLGVINIRRGNGNRIIASNHIDTVSFRLFSPVPLHQADSPRLDGKFAVDSQIGAVQRGNARCSCRTATQLFNHHVCIDCRFYQVVFYFFVKSPSMVSYRNTVSRSIFTAAVSCR